MDVVNETILPDGSWFGPKPGTNRWENPWLTMGLDENGFPKYIVKAFEISTKYAPNVKLVYNQNAGMQKPMWDRLKETILYQFNLMELKMKKMNLIFFIFLEIISKLYLIVSLKKLKMI